MGSGSSHPFAWHRGDSPQRVLGNEGHAGLPTSARDFLSPRRLLHPQGSTLRPLSVTVQLPCVLTVHLTCSSFPSGSAYNPILASDSGRALGTKGAGDRTLSAETRIQGQTVSERELELGLDSLPGGGVHSIPLSSQGRLPRARGRWRHQKGITAPELPGRDWRLEPCDVLRDLGVIGRGCA